MKIELSVSLKVDQAVLDRLDRIAVGIEALKPAEVEVQRPALLLKIGPVSEQT